MVDLSRYGMTQKQAETLSAALQRLGPAVGGLSDLTIHNLAVVVTDCIEQEHRKQYDALRIERIGRKRRARRARGRQRNCDRL